MDSWWVLLATTWLLLLVSCVATASSSGGASSSESKTTTADETFWLQTFFGDEEIAAYRAKFHATATPASKNKKKPSTATASTKPSLYSFFEHDAIFNATEMYSENVTMIDLFDLPQVTQWCDLDRLPTESQRFTPCRGPYQNVLLWKTPFTTPNPYPPSGLSQYHALVPHLFAIRDVFITWNGQIFDLSDRRPWKWPSPHHPEAPLPQYSYPTRNYRHGGCADLSWASGWANLTMAYFHRRIFHHTPILNLNHPYEGNVFHEVIEIYAQLFTFRPLLQRWPRMPIVMSARMYHTVTKYWPLLRWYGVLHESLEELNLQYFTDERELVLAPYIITPVLGECCMLLPSLVTTLKAAIEAEEVVPAFDGPMASLLGERLAKPRGYHLRRFYGRNESFAQIVTWFHQAVLIVGVHGAGLTNILFARPNTTVVEIRPENFAVTTIEHLGRSLGLRYHVFHCGRGRYRGPIPIKPYQLVDYLMPLVP
eukprot:gene13146-9414_t